MRIERKGTTLLVSILLVSLLLSFVPQASFKPSTKPHEIGRTEPEHALERTLVSGVLHIPIVIFGDGGFKAQAELEGWLGNGDESSPYIIEGFDIDLGGSNGRCIEITDTSVHFIIRNCSLTDASSSGGIGIRLWNVSNYEVSNNILYNNYIGMVLNGNNASIVDNDFDAGSGNYGINTDGLGNAVISGNTFTGGLVSLGLTGLDQCEISHNTVTGSPDISMHLYLSHFVTVSDNDFSGAVSVGIYLDFSDNCTIIRNNASNGGIGIVLDESNDNSFRECTLEGNTNGISFVFSEKNVVEFCDIQDSPQWGILIESTSTRNLFRWNVFRNLSFGPAQCDAIVNIFDYNYYDYYVGVDENGDGIGDFPHPIPGTANAADYHPLLLEPTFPVWNPSPTNQVLEFGNRFSYSLGVSSPVPIEDWYISDTAHFMVDDTGTIMDHGILEVGTYPIDVVITNTHTLSLESSFTVTVEDTVSPVWISQIQDKSFGAGEDIEIQLTAWDLAGIDSWDISDSENFSIASSSFAETGVVTISDIGDLAAGTYTLSITAYDPSGNYVAASFSITVTGPSGAIEYELIMSTAGVGLGLVALIVALVTSVKARKGS
jgi:parallel beta-helix repeat protein